MAQIYVRGTGSYLPEKVLTNLDLQKIMDTSDEWIFKRTGIRERRVAAQDQAASDLALPACRAAIERAGLTAADIGLIIMATITPDTQCPAGANWLQAKLNASQALTFDITAACSGFIFGIHAAEKFLMNGFCENALVVGSEVMTKATDWTNRSNAILWGDGAGAVVLSTTGDPGHTLLSVHAHTDGANGQNLLVPGGGSLTTPINHESINQKKHTILLIEPSTTMRVAVNHFAEACHEAVQANGLAIQDIDWFIPHQANMRIVKAVAKRLKVDMDRFYMTIEKYGNMSSASCAVAFDEAEQTGALKKGDLVCLTVFGGGLTRASALIRW